MLILLGIVAYRADFRHFSDNSDYISGKISGRIFKEKRITGEMPILFFSQANNEEEKLIFIGRLVLLLGSTGVYCHSQLVRTKQGTDGLSWMKRRFWWLFSSSRHEKSMHLIIEKVIVSPSSPLRTQSLPLRIKQKKISDASVTLLTVRQQPDRMVFHFDYHRISSHNNDYTSLHESIKRDTSPDFYLVLRTRLARRENDAIERFKHCNDDEPVSLQNRSFERKYPVHVDNWLEAIIAWSMCFVSLICHSLAG